MAKDPKFCEKVIVDALDSVSTPQSANNLQGGAQLAILDAFDRGVNRDAFIDILQSAMLLHTYSARLTMVDYMRHIVEKTGRDLQLDDLKEGIHEVTAICEGHRTKLMGFVEKLVSCPLEDDTLH